MKKKEILIIIGVLVAACLSVFLFYFIRGLNKSTEEEKEFVVSSVYLEMKSSLRIDLNKDEKVIDVVALNDEAEYLVPDNYKDKELDYVFYRITSNLASKEDTDDLVILVSTTGDISSEKVEIALKKELTNNNINGEVLTQEIGESANSKGKEYGISGAKAALIEGMIESDSSLSFDELKDKSISELNSIKNKPVEEPKKEELVKKEETKPSTGTGTSSGSAQKSTNKPATTVSCIPPSDLKDPAWCTFNTSRPQSCEYSYPQKKDYMELGRIASEVSGATNMIGSMATSMAKSGASYCEVYKSDIVTREYVYTVILDSVTGEVVSNTKSPLPAFAITEDQAKQMGLAYFSLDEANCNNCWVSFGTNGASNGGWYYRYQVNMEMNDGKSYSVDYNAQTGAYVTSRTW